MRIKRIVTGAGLALALVVAPVAASVAAGTLAGHVAADGVVANDLGPDNFQAKH
jgi:hypothetical protein